MPPSVSLEDLLNVETSRRNTDLVAGLIFQEPGLFDKVMEIFLRDEEPVSRRAAWVVDTASEKYPGLLTPWIGKIADSLPGFTHDGMKRQSLRMLMRSEIPAEQTAKLMNLCFEYLTSSTEAVAAKVYSMEILYSLSQTEPDIRQELADSIEWRMNEETAGFRNKGMKILKKLNKELRDLHQLP